LLLSKKKFVVCIIAICIFLSASLNYILVSSFSGIPVLNYHQVNNDAHNILTLSSSEFDAQMAYLAKAGYTTVTPDQLIDYLHDGKSLPPKPIMITFDDGYEDNYRVAYPILQKYDFTATMFLITDFVGSNGRYLTWEQVKEMHDKGFSFGSHTLSHIVLTNASDDDMRVQLIKSREAIEWRLKQKVEYLAYPGGFYNQRVIEVAKQAGYRAAFTTNLGRDKLNCGLFTLNRIPIFANSHTFLHFWLRLKFTQVLIAMQDLKNSLNKFGASTVASWIYIP
jgi:peptidoglycan/xylan/chitin deacetylase (PgdA/CDA1 family)